jgi:hypothetical protein
MTERMNDDVVARDLIKNQLRVRRGVDAPDGPVVGWDTDAWMRQQKVDNSADAGMDPSGALW